MSQGVLISQQHLSLQQRARSAWGRGLQREIPHHCPCCIVRRVMGALVLHLIVPGAALAVACRPSLKPMTSSQTQMVRLCVGKQPAAWLHDTWQSCAWRCRGRPVSMLLASTLVLQRSSSSRHAVLCYAVVPASKAAYPALYDCAPF